MSHATYAEPLWLNDQSAEDKLFLNLPHYAADIIKQNQKLGGEYFCFYCSCLFSIHEKANCIAVFWTGCPHSLVSYHFRGVWTICLLHKDGAVSLSALLKNTTSKLAGLFSTASLTCRTQSREAVDAI